MTFNVHRDRAGDRNTVDAVGAAGADIVCLQEVTAAWEAALRERYATEYPYSLFAPKENAGGLAVLSRFPLEDHGVVPIEGDLHPGWVVHAIAPDPGVRMQLVVVHLRSLFNGSRDWISNYFASDRDHVREMHVFMGRAQPELPTIVLGDFNESPDGDAVRLLEGRGYRNALPAFRPGQYTWKGASIGHDMVIDHILVPTPSFDLLDAWVGRRGGSDHLPVVARIELVRE
jgi:vancomycin resistance protein VanJ